MRFQLEVFFHNDSMLHQLGFTTHSVSDTTLSSQWSATAHCRWHQRHLHWVQLESPRPAKFRIRRIPSGSTGGKQPAAGCYGILQRLKDVPSRGQPGTRPVDKLWTAARCVKSRWPDNLGESDHRHSGWKWVFAIKNNTTTIAVTSKLGKMKCDITLFSSILCAFKLSHLCAYSIQGGFVKQNTLKKSDNAIDNGMFSINTHNFRTIFVLTSCPENPCFRFCWQCETETPMPLIRWMHGYAQRSGITPIH